MAERDWRIGVGFSVSILLLGASLGVVPDLVTDGWFDSDTRGRCWTFAGFAATGGLLLTVSVLAWRRRNHLRRRRGTAYIIKEESREWTREQSQPFLAQLDQQFARTLWVPGPDKLDQPWGWPLGDGAEHWDEKVDELVRSFRSTSYNDDHQTANALYMWAWWAVALAFGARATTGQRDLALDVRQRPSFGRMGTRETVDWSQPPHRFRRGDAVTAARDVQPRTEPRELTWPAAVTVTPRGTAPRTADPPRAENLRVLLVRLNPMPWGPLPKITPEAPAEPGETPVTFDLEDAAHLGFAGTFPTTIRELRCIPADGGTHPWHAFPSLVRSITDWIIREAAASRGSTLLLGTTLPPEVALGLGIDAGQLGASGWPADLWPIVYGRIDQRETLVVPRLNLGRLTTSTPRH